MTPREIREGKLLWVSVSHGCPCQGAFAFFSSGSKLHGGPCHFLLHIVLDVATSQKSNAQSVSGYSYISVFRTHLQHGKYVVIYPAFHAVAVTYGKMSLESSLT